MFFLWAVTLVQRQTTILAVLRAGTFSSHHDEHIPFPATSCPRVDALHDFCNYLNRATNALCVCMYAYLLIRQV